MPARNDIQGEIMNARLAAQDAVRKRYLKDLAEATGNDTLLYFTAYSSTKINIPVGCVTVNVTDMQGLMSAMGGLGGKNLDLIIHSPGGSVEAAEQIVNYLRSKYDRIRAIIPQNAMSAATMIACACDEIVMGKHSAIGPIDPQITFPAQNGIPFTAPAHSILNEFETARKEVLANPQIIPIWVSRLAMYPPALLDMCHNTINLSKQKVENWLSSYMFRDDSDRFGKARHVAEWLGTFDKHLTHGRPIPYNVAQDNGLNVSLLEDCQWLQEKVLSVFHAAMVTVEVTNCVKIIENQNGVGMYFQWNNQCA